MAAAAAEFKQYCFATVRSLPRHVTQYRLKISLEACELIVPEICEPSGAFDLESVEGFLQVLDEYMNVHSLDEVHEHHVKDIISRVHGVSEPRKIAGPPTPTIRSPRKPQTTEPTKENVQTAKVWTLLRWAATDGQSISCELSTVRHTNEDLFSTRYRMLADVLKTTGEFQWWEFACGDVEDWGLSSDFRPIIYPVQNLLGMTGTLHAFGCLCLDEEEDGSPKWLLQDQNASVELQLSRTAIAPFTFLKDGTFVVVRGHMRHRFQAELLRFPFRAEYRPGPPRGLSAAHRAKANALGALAVPQIWAIFAECRLDDPNVLENLLHILTVLDDPEVSPFRVLPVGLLFMGSFLGDSDMKRTRERFREFSLLLQRFTNLLRSASLVFSPGPVDFGLSSLPQHPLCPLARRELSSILRRAAPMCQVFFPENPFSFTQAGAMCVVMRRDLIREAADMTDVLNSPLTNRRRPVLSEVSATVPDLVLSQRHLAPHVSELTREQRPLINRSRASSLWLQHLPNVLVFADSGAAPYKKTFSGVQFVNPGCIASGQWVTCDFTSNTVTLYGGTE